MEKLDYMCRITEPCTAPREGDTDGCADCNHTLRRIARDLNRMPKPVKPLRRVPVQKISEKQVNITSELNKVYEMMDAEARESGGGILHCSAYPDHAGLNEYTSPIDHSHTISRARCKQLGKPELIYDPANIEHCSRVAHTEWDNYSPEFVKHANFQKRMDYIKQYDPHDYDRRMEVWAAANPVKDKTI